MNLYRVTKATALKKAIATKLFTLFAPTLPTPFSISPSVPVVPVGLALTNGAVSLGLGPGKTAVGVPFKFLILK